MDSCEADGLACAPDLLLQHALHDVVAAQRDREAAALVVLAVRVHRRPSYPRAPLLRGAMLRRAVRRARNALRNVARATVKGIVAVAVRGPGDQEREWKVEPVGDRVAPLVVRELVLARGRHRGHP